MIITSNEFKQYVSESRDYIAGVTITLTDGTVLNLTDEKIRALSIEDSVSKDDSFTIGAALINKLTVVIDNVNGEYSKYDFTDAILRPTAGLQLSSTIETLYKGVYIADEFKSTDSIIYITALDNLSKFDKAFSDVTVVFPCTAQFLLTQVCSYCGVLLGTTTFTNSSYVIQARPSDEATTCREIVSWIAQIAGCFARCNTTGALELKWYDFEVFENSLDGGTFDSSTPYASGDSADGGNFTDYTSGDSCDGGTFTDMSRYHHIYSHGSITVSTDDVVITGIQVTDSTEAANKTLFGIEGYVIAIEGNDLIQSADDAALVANTVGNKIVGMRFRPLTTQSISDPSREAGDVAYITDRRSNTYQTVLTSVTFSIGQYDRISCDAESPSANSSTRYTEATKVLIKSRKETTTKISDYDLAVQRLTNLMTYSFGVFKTEEKQTDGSIIYYMHNKPTLSGSTTIWKITADAFAVSTDSGATWNAGFDSQGNAVVNVLSAVGINAKWIKAGKLYSTDGATLIDLDYGVANSDNISESENVQNGFPLILKFNIDSKVAKISEVLLNYSQKNFRTYSTTASSGGGTSLTSGSGGSSSGTTGTESEVIVSTGADIPTVSGQISPHFHTVEIPQHSHSFSIADHVHLVNVPTHIHELNFGIQEQAISDYSFNIYVDGTLRQSIANDSANAQGIVDLTAYITTIGWHTIEIQSTTLKRVSAQINIKSYIRS